jgi:transcriptional regulator with XRE-family HTH domain
MPGLKKQSFARYTLAAVQLLGQLVKTARIERRMSAGELASRLGVGRGTVHRLEQGDPKLALGVAFEACAILGIALFNEDRQGLTDRYEEGAKLLALLPKAVRSTSSQVDDDF